MALGLTTIADVMELASTTDWIDKETGLLLLDLVSVVERNGQEGCWGPRQRQDSLRALTPSLYQDITLVRSRFILRDRARTDTLPIRRCQVYTAKVQACPFSDGISTEMMDLIEPTKCTNRVDPRRLWDMTSRPASTRRQAGATAPVPIINGLASDQIYPPSIGNPQQQRAAHKFKRAKPCLSMTNKHLEGEEGPLRAEASEEVVRLNEAPAVSHPR